MSNYFGRLQETDLSDVIRNIIHESRPQEEVQLAEATTSTSTLNEIPVEAQEIYPPTFPKHVHETKKGKRQGLWHTRGFESSAVSSVPLAPPKPRQDVHHERKTSGDAFPFLDFSPAISSKSTNIVDDPHESTTSSIRDMLRERSPDSSIFTQHSEASLYALPTLGYSLPKKDKDVLILEPDGVDNPTVPRLCCQTYGVYGLQESDEICVFFARVLMCKIGQLLIITLWLLLVTNNKSLFNIIAADSLYFLAVPITIYILLLVGLRCCAFRGPLGLVPSVIVLVVQSGCLALTAGTVSINFRSPLLLLLTLTLLLSSVKLAALFWGRNLIVKGSKKLDLLVAPFAVTMITILIFFLVTKADRMELTSSEFLRLWLPLLASSALILEIFILELLSVVRGRRFPVSSADWIFTTSFF